METPPTGPTEPDRGPQSPAPEAPMQPHQAPPPQPPQAQQPPGGWDQPLPAGPPRKFASWWSRVGAAIVDGLVIGVPTAIIAVVLGIGAASSDDDTGAGAFLAGIFLTVLVAVVIGFLYAPLLMARQGRNNGQTWGKQLTNIRVVKAEGSPITFGYAAIRELLVKGLLFNGIGGSFFFPWILNYLWPLWDDQNRALHDMIVNSRVVEAS